MLDWDGVKTKANADGEFGIHARMWNSSLRISIGDQRTRIDIEGGTVKEIQPWHGGGPTDLAISAPQQDWDELLRAVPKPFYQDLYPAITVSKSQGTATIIAPITQPSGA